MFRKFLIIAGIMVVPCSTLLADFTYEETSAITGGALAGMLKVVGVFSKQAREPIHSTIAVKGDKMVHRSANTASIIDLGAQTITSIDFQKKTYSVMTFEQMQQALQQMQQKMKGNNQGQLQFKVSANNTGATREISGFNTKEMLVKMELEGTDQQSGQKGGMLITTDMWVAPAVSGYGEVRDFYKRLGEKLNWTPGGNMLMANPDASRGMAEVYKEMAKVDGMPVQQTITMGGSGQPAPTGEQPAAQQQQTPQEKPSIGGALGGALGGRFGLGKKKQNQDQQPGQEQPAPSGNAQSSGALLEMKTEMSGFSANSVDSAQFSVPAGFKMVDPDTKRLGR